jgi:hypothetical protein
MSFVNVILSDVTDLVVMNDSGVLFIKIYLMTILRRFFNTDVARNFDNKMFIKFTPDSNPTLADQ